MKGKTMQIKFSTENEAFQDYNYPHIQIAMVLKRIAGQVEDGMKSGVIMDSNGNKVGRWSL